MLLSSVIQYSNFLSQIVTSHSKKNPLQDLIPNTLDYLKESLYSMSWSRCSALIKKVFLV